MGLKPTGIDCSDLLGVHYTPGRGDRDFGVRIRLKPAAAARLKQILHENEGRSLARVFGGKVLSDPIIPVDWTISQVLHWDAGSRDQAREIFRSVRACW